MSKQDLKSAYNTDAGERGRPFETDKSFTRGLKRWKPDLAEGQRTWKGKAKAWCWLGIGLKRDLPPDVPTEVGEVRTGSHCSHHSQVSPYFVPIAHEGPDGVKEETEEEQEREKQNRANPVNGVNPVTKESPAAQSRREAEEYRQRREEWLGNLR